MPGRSSHAVHAALKNVPPTLVWVCLHCDACNRTDTDALECDLPDGGCLADVHAAWLECQACGWETRLVKRADDGSIVTTHTKASSIGKAGTA